MFDLVQGDCLKKMKAIPDGSIDMILTDPPYGTTACKWGSVINLDLMWKQLTRIIKDNGAIVMTASQPFTTMLIHSNIKNFKYCWVWEKPQGVDPFMAKHRPLNNVENVVVFSYGKCSYIPQLEKGDAYTVSRDKSSRKHELTGATMRPTTTINKGTRLPKRVLKFKQQKGLHPTQKPVPLMEYLIKTYTNEGDTILDFTMGSGSTGVACGQTNRRFIGIELDEEYFEIAQSRVYEAYGGDLLN